MDVHDLINKSRNYLLNIITIIVAVIIASNIYGTKAKRIAILKDEVSTELKINEILQDMNGLEKKFTPLKNTINNKAISQVIDSLGNIAKVSDVRIAFIRPGNEKRLGVYSLYPFDMEISAKNYHGIGKFVSMLENSLDIYFVEQISIAFNLEEAEDKITAKLALNTILIN